MDEKEIEQLLDKFGASTLKDFELVDKDFKLALSKRDQAPIGTVRPESVAKSDPQSEITAKTPLVKKASASPTPIPVLPVIKAPLVGVVYFAPSPDKPAFKQVGDKVKKGEVVCVIEAMKLINEVKSPISGIIKEKLVEDGSMVEFDEPIFKVEAL